MTQVLAALSWTQEEIQKAANCSIRNKVHRNCSSTTYFSLFFASNEQSFARRLLRTEQAVRAQQHRSFSQTGAQMTYAFPRGGTSSRSSSRRTLRRHTANRNAERTALESERFAVAREKESQGPPGNPFRCCKNGCTCTGFELSQHDYCSTS